MADFIVLSTLLPPDSGSPVGEARIRQGFSVSLADSLRGEALEGPTISGDVISYHFVLQRIALSAKAFLIAVQDLS